MMTEQQLRKTVLYSSGHWLCELTVGTEDVAKHSPEVFILREAVHHLGQAARAVGQEVRQAISKSCISQELSHWNWKQL